MMFNASDHLSRGLFVRPTLFRLLLVLIGLLFCHACAGVAPPELKVDRPSVNDLLIELDLSGRRFVTVRGLAKVAYVESGKKRSVSQVIIAQSPGSLRLETLGLFGSTALMATTNDEELVVLVPGEGKAYVGRPDSGFLQRMIQLPLSADDIVSILLIHPVIVSPETTARIDYQKDGRSLLSFTTGPYQQEVGFDQSRRLVSVVNKVDDRIISSLTYGRYQDGFPALIQLDFVKNDIKVTLDFSDIETNIDLDPDIFRIVPPPEYKIEPIPEF